MRFRRERQKNQEPKSQDWMNDFLKDVDKAAKDIERRSQRDNEIALQQLSEEFDVDIEARRREQEAIARRDITLKKAWLAQTALKENNIPTDEWIDYRPDFDTRGIFRKKIRRERNRIASIAFSGWALDKRGNVLITTDADNPLAIAIREYPRDAKVDSLTEYRHYLDMNKVWVNIYKEAAGDEILRTYDIRDKINGWYNLCTVENKLMHVKTNNIKEVNQQLEDNRPFIYNHDISLDGSSDVDYEIQKMMVAALAAKVKNPNGEHVQGRSFF